jgi:hypothetical protein
LLVLLTALAFLLTHGMRWFVPVLAAQSVLLAAAGERTPVITDAVALVVLLLWCGYRPTRQQRRAAAALTVVAILAVTGVRVERGRAIYYSDSGLGARVTALAAGIGAAGRAAPGSPGFLAQAAVRLDGVDFAAAILQARALGDSRLDAPGVPESLLLAVPSALWRGKLAHAINPVQSELDAFGMQQINFLPGLAGLYAGFLPPLWLIAFLGALGMGWGRAERWLLHEVTAARLVLVAGAVIGALSYEQGLPGMVVAFRPAVAVTIAMSVLRVAADKGAAHWKYVTTKT